jgi:tRNA1(Val) A37 N6-methylase TrmN6
MPSCCQGDEYGSVFSERAAWGTVARFRRRGLRGSGRELVAAVSAHLTPGSSVLEVGGGAGQLGVALLDSGAAATVVNVDLSAGWEAPARALLEERGLSGRVERILGDFVDEHPSLADADAVVLHKVICCYPDWQSMLTASEEKARHLMAFTVPVDRWWTRSAAWIDNLWTRVRGIGFRAFVHPPDAMIEAMAVAGFGVAYDHSRAVWRTLVMVRDVR